MDPLMAEKALKMGQFGTTNGSKTGQKQWFSKSDPSPVVVPKWMNAGDFEPLLSCSYPPSNA